ncbi:MAG: protein translocase subunit SecD, partial [Bacteroidales bacterium]|nr:protein translocase subunit SecD [Bacteroidales bacterium]
MRNKGAIILVAVLLSLICLYYLSFTIKSNQISSRATKHAEAQFQKMGVEVSDIEKNYILEDLKKEYLDSLLNEKVFWMFKSYTYNELREREMALGLDLKGGMNVTIEVSASDIIKALSNNKNDTLLNKAINVAVQQQVASNEGFVNLFAKSYAEVSNNKSLANLFITANNSDKITIQSSNEEVVAYLREEYSAAIGNANEVLRKRIDHFGVVQPNIQEDFAIKGRFHIELPGIKDPERVRKLLQGTATLEFWETFENEEVIGRLDEVNTFLQKTDIADTVDEDIELEQEVTEELEIVEATTESSSIILDDDIILDENVESVESVETTETEEPSLAFEQSNPLFDLLIPNVTQQGELLPGPVVGRALVKDTAKINAIFRDKKVRDIIGDEIVLAWTFKSIDKTKDYYELVALRRDKQTDGAALGGDVITNAREEFAQGSGSAEVSMGMDTRGSNEWARITRLNKGRSIAIVLDGYVYSYPTVQNEIKGGRSSITGNFTINEAKDLANVLKSGKMPAPARILSEEIVGPSLGQKAVSSGLNSFIIAFIIVMLYMVVYYGRPGFTANLALIANIFFIFGVLASFGAVLTLPGIAGVVLTIGMAVDANILIFERVREEMRSGKALSLAIKEGYKNAMSAILDANITTLLIGIILFNFGVGPIQGFATTLIIGILASLFSAIFITRLVFDRKVKKGQEIVFETGISKNAFKNVNIQFLSKRKISFVVSAILIVVSLVSLTTRGLNPGIDFAGGRNYIVKFDESISSEKVADALKDV